MTPEEKDKLKKEIEELDKRLQRSNEKDKETEQQMNIGMKIAIAGGIIVLLWAIEEAIKVFAPETYNAILSVFGIN